MNLENFKIKKIIETPEEIFRIFLALVFLTAGLFRIFNPDMAVFEFTALRLPIWLSGFMVFFEIGASLGLLLNKYVKIIYWLLALFLLFVLVWALMISGRNIFMSAGELFIFNLNPTDWFLHFTFFLIIVFLLSKKKLI
jgi:uncharacterized membrane protein YphA (DoxX/SURF4 family)